MTPSLFLRRSIAGLSLVTAIAWPMTGLAQLPVVAADNQEMLLVSHDPKLAANKRLVYDFWREVFEGLHMDQVDKYLTEQYLQHNPNVPSGRAAFVAFFSRRGSPKPIEPRIKAPLVSIVAEGDMVVLSFAREGADPNDSSKKYTTTWFDMFRVEGGKIAEHWDPALKVEVKVDAAPKTN